MFMKSILNFSLIVLVFSLVFVSCKKDPESTAGCNDSTADNFNPAATEDNGSCTYQSRFIGEYSGNLKCAGILAFVFSTAEMSITEVINKTEVNVIMQTAVGPIPVIGQITKDKLTVNTELKNIAIKPSSLFNGAGDEDVFFNIGLNGELTISADNKTLSGDINISLTPLEDIVTAFYTFKANVAVVDKCGFTGTKK
jgi:hypothetical protein